MPQRSFADRKSAVPQGQRVGIRLSILLGCSSQHFRGRRRDAPTLMSTHLNPRLETNLVSNGDLSDEPEITPEKRRESRTATAIVHLLHNQHEAKGYADGFMAALRAVREHGLPQTIELKSLYDPVARRRIMLVKINQEGCEPIEHIIARIK